MKLSTFAVCATLAMAFHGCTPLTTTKLPSRPIDKSYVIDGIRWSNNDSPLVFLFQTFNSDGKVEICGAYTFEKDHLFQGRSFNDLAIGYSTIKLDGEILLDDLSHFNKVAYPTNGKGYPKADARCVKTDRDWAEGLKPEFDYSKSTSITLRD